ncbi:uracil-DNA glycosylase [Pontibacter sp. G13]|uniref:uracil-DNA glycosylase n=1 Tax=Pontibacter sp. G13 TaxID=3074898 RepID=UPI00288AAD80|nr:uracil-DNA glycosylase [Pontibacter sp. G13]WNJ16477.1 uracil-DNA glycosylase [Pontibacter sp. G13]
MSNQDRVKIEAGWKQALQAEWDKDYFQQLRAFIVQEMNAGHQIFPPATEIFRAFDLTPFEETQVVILGQDPYHGPGQAHGLCFSVPHGIRTPPSLKNIYKEMAEDVGTTIPDHGNLEKWAKQGILLLNSMLTVRAGAAGSHKGKGWETFTDAVIAAVNEQKSGVVFLLWGRYAHQKGAFIDRSKHLVLEAAHPSPLARGAYFGSKHFSKTNQWLAQQGKKQIDWQV